jgi:hypothetical protein
MTMPSGERTVGIAASPRGPDVDPPRRQREPRDTGAVGPGGWSTRRLTATFLAMLVVVTPALALYWQRDLPIVPLVNSLTTQTQHAIQSWSKLSYHVGQLGPAGPSSRGQARTSKP